MSKRAVLLPPLPLLLAFSALAQDYKLEPVATAAPGLPAAYAAAIQTQGYRVTGTAGPWCEVWLAKQIPAGAKPSDSAISFGIAQGLTMRFEAPIVPGDMEGHGFPGESLPVCG